MTRSVCSLIHISLHEYKKSHGLTKHTLNYNFRSHCNIKRLNSIKYEKNIFWNNKKKIKKFKIFTLMNNKKGKKKRNIYIFNYIIDLTYDLYKETIPCLT
jgi:hypothetical protein